MKEHYDLDVVLDEDVLIERNKTTLEEYVVGSTIRADMNGWEIVGRPGAFSGGLKARIEFLNEIYGMGNWKMVWKLGDRYYGFLGQCRFYEVSYRQYLRDNPDLLDFLVSHRDIIDNDESNVVSGTDYRVQETWKGIHIQDIALRRSVESIFNEPYTKVFDPEGDLLCVRSKEIESGGAAFSPFYVPFAFPRLVEQPAVPGNYRRGSVEEQHQSCKFLAVKSRPRKADNGPVKIRRLP